ncbi:MAG TPA: DUF371 domain-containing protein [Methanocorpusculum sp.]|nr:DUF371 domain-containing protein [Methanocorpusculum sp.]
MEVTEIIHCRGHENVRGLHKSTFEVTKETELSPRGDCIIGVGADKGCADLSPAFKAAMTRPQAVLTTVLEAGGISVTVTGSGSELQTFENPVSFVWRTSAFISDRTIAIGTDHAARDLPRDLIDLLRTGAELTVTMTVTVPE